MDNAKPVTAAKGRAIAAIRARLRLLKNVWAIIVACLS
jgi:hypothetical protein